MPQPLKSKCILPCSVPVSTSGQTEFALSIFPAARYPNYISNYPNTTQRLTSTQLKEFLKGALKLPQTF